MMRCPRCGALPLHDTRTWKYAYTECRHFDGEQVAVERHLCPVCVFQGGADECRDHWNY